MQLVTAAVLVLVPAGEPRGVVQVSTAAHQGKAGLSLLYNPVPNRTALKFTKTLPFLL